MSVPHAIRLTTFGEGRFSWYDFASHEYTKVTYEPVDGPAELKAVFERTGNRTWLLNNEDEVYTGVIPKMLNTQGVLYGFKQAIVTIDVKDPFLPNPFMIQVPRTYRYGIVYLKEYKDCLNCNRKFIQNKSLVSCFPLINDKPLRKITDVIPC